jgi:esterase/lipase superfamily enzyme
VTIESKALGVTKHFYVALPPGYHSLENRSRRYPVVYLFRGHEREWVHRWQDRSRRGRTVIDVYRELLQAGQVGPMVLVFPGISSDDNRVPGLLVNFLAPELAKGAPGVGTGRFEDYFLEELMPCVDTMFRTVQHRMGRAVDGFSLGGFQAIKIAALRPDLFCSAGSFDGTFLYATRGGRSVRARDRVLRNPMLDPAFGVPRNLEYVAANNPANLIWRGDRQALAQVQWLIASCPQTGEPWQSNYYRNQHLVGILERRGLHNAMPAVIEGSRHNWRWADRYMGLTLPLHWQALEHSTRLC